MALDGSKPFIYLSIEAVTTTTAAAASVSVQSQIKVVMIINNNIFSISSWHFWSTWDFI